jgi:hypothetical protein
MLNSKTLFLNCFNKEKTIMHKKFLRTSLKLLGFAMMGLNLLPSQECSACWWWAHPANTNPPHISKASLGGPEKEYCCWLTCNEICDCGIQLFKSTHTNYLLDYSDQQLREHTAQCPGFYLHTTVINPHRLDGYSQTHQHICHVCSELEKRVMDGPCKSDLPIPHPNKKSWDHELNGKQVRVTPWTWDPIPQSSLLTIMPTKSSDQEFIEEYQKLKINFNKKDYSLDMIYNKN